jgi:hypothetical protein
MATLRSFLVAVFVMNGGATRAAARTIIIIIIIIIHAVPDLRRLEAPPTHCPARDKFASHTKVHELKKTPEDTATESIEIQPSLLNKPTTTTTTTEQSREDEQAENTHEAKVQSGLPSGGHKEGTMMGKLDMRDAHCVSPTSSTAPTLLSADGPFDRVKRARLFTCPEKKRFMFRIGG